MGTDNFPVSFASAAGNAFCQVALNPRFDAVDLVDDHPRTITLRYLDGRA